MISRILSQENLLSRESSMKTARGLPDFKQGDVFRGEIVRKFAHGEVLVRSGGKSFRAVTDQNVKQGEQCDFRVRSAAGKHSPAVLENLPKTGPMLHPGKGMERITALVSELSSAISLKNLSPKTSAVLRSLSNALPALVYRGPAGDPVSWLSRFVADGGLFWEGKTARCLKQGIRSNWKLRLGSDLKGMLLDLQRTLKSEKQESPQIESTCKKVDEALDLIQKIQLENRDLLRVEGCWFVFVPGGSDEGFQGAELYARRSMEEKEIRFSMLLDFTFLGPVEVTASVLDSAISVRFEVSDEEKAEFVRSNLGLLQEALNEKGLMPARVFCEVHETASKDGGGQAEAVQPGDSVDLVI
jgi:hypothetical protein